MRVEIEDINNIKNMPGYEDVLAKALEYDRVITIVQEDPVYTEFNAAKALFKSFCIDSYRTGKSPINLLTELELDANEVATKGTTEQRAASKIEKFYKKLDKHLADPVVFKAEELKKTKLHELYGKLTSLYSILKRYTIDNKDKGTPITQDYYHDVKKGDEDQPGLVKTLKKEHPELVKSPELIAGLKEALRSDGITNEKTLDKIDTIAAKANKPKDPK